MPAAIRPYSIAVTPSRRRAICNIGSTLILFPSGKRKSFQRASQIKSYSPVNFAFKILRSRLRAGAAERQIRRSPAALSIARRMALKRC